MKFPYKFAIGFTLGAAATGTALALLRYDKNSQGMTIGLYRSKKSPFEEQEEIYPVGGTVFLPQI